MAAHRAEHLGAGELEADRPQEVRAFFGLPLPDEHRAALAGFLEGCAAAAPQFRWTPPANLHLTLRFVGAVEAARVLHVADRVDDQRPQGFEVALGEVGTFKRGRLARVVWLGVRKGVEDLTQLAAQVDEACVASELAGEDRAFKAHLTLARSRVRDGAALPKLPPLPLLQPWPATALVLYSSHLGRAGATYEPLRTIRLEGG